jgi:hypothetical protein
MEEKTEIRRFVRAIFKNAGTNQLQPKLIKKMEVTKRIIAELTKNDSKYRNES